jgi:hypothetical protein
MYRLPLKPVEISAANISSYPLELAVVLRIHNKDLKIS